MIAGLGIVLANVARLLGVLDLFDAEELVGVDSVVLNGVVLGIHHIIEPDGAGRAAAQVIVCPQIQHPCPAIDGLLQNAFSIHGHPG